MAERRHAPNFVPAPLAETQRGRVALLAEAAARLCDSRNEAERFLGSAIRAFLMRGGDLVRDHLRIAAERGKKDTPQRVAQQYLKPPKSRF